MKIRGSQGGCRDSRTFRNATGGFPSTAPSIPLILTGRYYDNSVPFQDFVKSTFKSASLPQQLKAANYHVYYNNLYDWPSLYADPSIASHVLKKTLRWHDAQARRWASGLMLLGVFRSLPQFGKRLLEGAVAKITPSLAWDDAYGEETLPMGPHARGDDAGRRRRRLLQCDDVGVIGHDEDSNLQVLPSLGHSLAVAAR